ncbi:MAG: DNA cytosine methyltransferase [Crocinitomicaceae bacterium]|nr:DNA cytosine methyltransferase [Crocinitomicaceae bacterium]
MGKFKFIDLFAGAGGFSAGFEMAGYDLVCAVEKDEWAVDTLKANHSPERIILGNIEEIVNIKSLISDSPHVIIGGPPCQGFSVAASKKHDPKDPRNSLFVHFVNWVKEASPEIFVMENVPGILSRKNANGTKISDIIIEAFESLDYKVDIWRLNAVNYGVPQSRERVFFVGNRKGISLLPPPKTHSYFPEDDGLLPVVTIGEAILDLPQIEAGQGDEISDYDTPPNSDYQRWSRNGSNHLYNHVSMNHTKRLVDRFRAIQNGDVLDNLPDELKVKARNGNGELSNAKFNSNYRHLKTNQVSRTIPASFYSSFIHPLVPRNLTTREAARIQSFPDNYQFKGKRTLISKKLLQRLGKDYSDRLSQYNQVGNAVPPLLSKAIAEHIKQFIFEAEMTKRKNKRKIKGVI